MNNKTSKLICAFLCLVLIATVGFAPMGALAEEETEKTFWNGEAVEPTGEETGSTEDDPIKISNASELYWIVSNGWKTAGKYYKLENDIYVNDITVDSAAGTVTGTETAYEWAWVDSAFQGFLDGDGHVVSGLYIDESYEGVARGYALMPFGKNCTVKNMGIVNSYLKATGATASAFIGHTGNTKSELENCFVGEDVYVEGENAATFYGYGALRPETKITNCYSLAKLVGTKAGAFSAGCWNGTAPTDLTVTNSYTNGQAYGNAPHTFVNSFAASTIATQNGLTILTAENMQGTRGAYNMAVLSENYVISGGYPVLRSFTSRLADEWSGFFKNVTLEGAGTSDNPYKITSAEDLAYVIGFWYGNGGKYYKLTEDIYLNDPAKVDWTTGECIDDYFACRWFSSYNGDATSYLFYRGWNIAFNGNIDGDGHTVYGLYYEPGQTGLNAGLVPTIANATVSIKNLAVKNSYLYSARSGAVVGSTDNKSDCILNVDSVLVDNTVTVRGTSHSGGVVGYVETASSANIANTAAYASGNSFGLVGTSWNPAKISLENCITATCPINNNSSALASGGNVNLSISNVYNAGAVKSTRDGVINVAAADITGASALDNLTALSLDVWTKTAGYPIQKMFATYDIGDFDKDMDIDAADAAAMRGIIIGTVTDYTVADLDLVKDGAIDICDLVYLDLIVTEAKNEAIKQACQPQALTVSLYDTSTNTYGFTWNTDGEPLDPVLQICEGNSFDEEECAEYKATVSEGGTYIDETQAATFYVAKAQVQLTADKTYAYRIYDKAADVGTKVYKLTARNTNSSAFTFACVSDSQVAASGGVIGGYETAIPFNDTLKGIMSSSSEPDFLLHTGDFVEYSKYEAYWRSMIDYNASYLSTIPTMAISGNHETTYRNGSNETYKHFNVSIPEQSTEKGFYYSFDYSNTRFVMLNTNRLSGNKLTDDQYNWLESVLKNNTQEWTIVALHNPVYSVGKYGADPAQNTISLALREQLGDLFAENNVDLVLQGHDHAYSKTYPIGVGQQVDTDLTYQTIASVDYCVDPDGVIYAMNGPAGSQTRSPYGTVDTSVYELAGSSYASSWAEITVEDNKLTVKIMYYNQGDPQVWNSYGIIKN